MKPLLILLLALPLWAASQQQHFGVQSVAVTKEKTRSSRLYYGYTRADESRSVSVTPRFSGYITRLYADTRYARVKKGDPLAQLYSPEVLQAKEEYRNALLYDKSHGNPQMLRSARTKLELLGIDKAEIDALATAQKFESETLLRAPYSGYLFNKEIIQGAAFKAGSRLFEIVNTERLWVEAAIYQKELSELKGFSSFEVRAEGTQQWHKAKKELLLPEMQSSLSTATLRLSLDNTSQKLMPGMYCEVRASAAERERLLIPRSAAIRKHGKWYVFGEGEYEGEYEPREVRLTPLDAERYEVLSGLEEGEIVVNNALFMLDADAQINGLY